MVPYWSAESAGCRLCENAQQGLGIAPPPEMGAEATRFKRRADIPSLWLLAAPVTHTSPLLFTSRQQCPLVAKLSRQRLARRGGRKSVLRSSRELPQHRGSAEKFRSVASACGSEKKTPALLPVRSGQDQRPRHVVPCRTARSSAVYPPEVASAVPQAAMLAAQTGVAV